MSFKQNIKAFFCSALSVLLCFVIVFNLSFTAFHSQAEEHHHSEQNCSVDEEFDACHRYLIHHEKSAGCDGSHQHITNKTDHCFTCDFFKDQQKNIEPKTGVCLLNQTVSKLYSHTESRFGSSDHLYTFLRGPPSIG